MTTSRSAVSAISLIRWLETRTVRPCRGQVAQQVAHPADALGVEAVDRLVEEQHAGVAEQRAGDAEPLAHAEGELAGPPVGHRGEPDDVEDLVDAPVGDVVGPGQERRWLRALRPGWNALASSSAPTSRRGQRSSS